ncbi:hypothetical protein ACFL1E_01170 [Candidatus Omnitrophota bacterium]
MLRMLRNKKGVALIFAYTMLIPALVMVAAFFNKSINAVQNRVAQQNNMEAKIAADAGIMLAEHEMTKAGGWKTHNIQGDNSLLAVFKDGEPVPNVTLNGFCEIDQDVGSETYGCYVPKGGKVQPLTGARFAVKAFMSPHGDSIVYSKGFSEAGEAERLVVSKHSAQHLYEYFLFTPNDFALRSRRWYADNGKMHTNGNFTFLDDAEIFDVTEFSAAEHIEYYFMSYLPEDHIDDFMDETAGCEGCPHETWRDYYFTWHDPWIPANAEPDSGESLETYAGGVFKEYAYWNSNYGRLYGDASHLRTAGGALWDPDNDPDPTDNSPDTQPENYVDDASIAKINTFTLPNRFAEASYWTNKYWLPALQHNYDPPGDEEFVEVTHLNTLVPEQAAALMAYTAAIPELDGVIQEKNSGAKAIKKPSINVNAYAAAAANGGTVIKGGCGETVCHELSIETGGVSYGAAGVPATITVDGHVVAVAKTFKNAYSTNTNEVLEIDVGEMIAAGIMPPNGIIYSRLAPIVAVNAETLPEGGLTWVTRKNFHLKGDYNTVDWQPSAVICSKDVYTLSDMFNYPQAVPITVHHLENPYEADWKVINEGGEFAVDPEPGMCPECYNWMANLQGPFPGVPLYIGEMPNKVDRAYTYNISMIGPLAFEPKVLERWRYFGNDGDISSPPSVPRNRRRTIAGSIINTSELGFPSPDYAFALDQEVPRNGRNNPGWPYNYMAASGPTGPKNIFQFESRYSQLGEYPPGSDLSFAQLLYLEVPNTELNWNYYNDAYN